MQEGGTRPQSSPSEYDANGDRVYREGPDSDTFYLFDGLDVSYEEEQTIEGTVKRYYINALGRHIAKVEVDGEGSGGTGGEWSAAWDAETVSGDHTWGDYTASGRNSRMIVLAADTVAEGSRVRLTFKGHSSSSSQITGASIGPKKASSNPFDFSSAPTNITFNGGSESGTLPAGGVLVSDEIDFTFDGNTDYLVAIYSTDGDMGYLDMSNASYYRDGIGSDDSMTTDASSYWSNPYIEWLSKIEVYAESGEGTGYDTYFYHADYLGSVRMISDVTGAVVWQERYEPFGGEEQQSGTIENSYQFTGKGYDEATGLFYFNARWYDPNVGRFISEDPLWGNIQDPQSLNSFAYGRNNPFRFVDPTGKYSDDDLMDPYGRTYSVNEKTGEIRYEDSESDGLENDDDWSDWIDPNYNHTNYEESVRKQLHDERVIAASTKELEEWLKGGGITKKYRSREDQTYISMLTDSAKAAGGSVLIGAGIVVIKASPAAYGNPLGLITGPIVTGTGIVMFGSGTFLTVDAFYDITPLL